MAKRQAADDQADSPDQAPKKVTVESIKWHTNAAVEAGKEYDVGNTYEVPEEQVDGLRDRGLAVRVDRVAHAQAQRKAAEETQKARAEQGGGEARVMTTESAAGRKSRGGTPKARAPKAAGARRGVRSKK